MLVLVMFIAGCGTKQVQDTKAPNQPVVGTFDINKVIKAHPKYNQLIALQEQANGMAAEVEAKQIVAMQKMQDSLAVPQMSQGDMVELNKSFEQDFNRKMSAKQAELNTRFTAKEEAVHRTMYEEIKNYNDQLNKEYEPQIFNLQLKMKTVQLTKEETALLQTELERLQNQRAEKTSVKEQQLAAKMDELLAPEKATAEQELMTYSKQLNEEISKQVAAKQTEMAARIPQKPLASEDNKQATSDIEQQLTMKQQEIQALQDFITENIKDKAGKVAMERGLEAVLINTVVNVSGYDITDVLIAECNK